ncbi:MAG: 16S rRNA (uracil(1498)-N(3))-methyltransferase [Planctomycetes bacterium]|nr:16S rRNA (uracil(1498)-N(3))-methyltransferase [Planctomycetota bacterium]
MLSSNIRHRASLIANPVLHTATLSLSILLLMNRFFISKSYFQGEQVVLGRRQAHQIRNVLRMTTGGHIIVLDNTGYEYDVVLTEVRKDSVLGQIEQKRPAAGEPQLRLTLYQSLLARDKFELLLQKCTEIGIARFVPIVTQRSLVRDVDAVTPNKLTRWRRIITEAAEQSARGRIPELDQPVRFKQVVMGLAEFDLCLIASPQEQKMTLREALHQSRKKKPQTIALLIGPEGGFAEQEVRLARDSGAIPVSLGPRILRTETAAIVTTALILHELDA